MTTYLGDGSIASRAYEEWHEALMMAGSHSRGYVLLDAYHSHELTNVELRRLVGDFWTVCEAWGDHLDDALEMLEDVRPECPPLPPGEVLTVYRATGGETPDGGSWTLERAVAEKFAVMIASIRGVFLGVYSEDTVVWCGEVEAVHVLGYFTGRSESEVVLPHGAVLDVRPLAPR